MRAGTTDISDMKSAGERRLKIFYAFNIVFTLFLFYLLIRISSGISSAGSIMTLSSGVVTSNFLLLGFLALFFGLRHSVDADHIAAIDNSTRKLLGENKKSELTGFYFSLGHSTIVIALSVSLMVATRYIIETLPRVESAGVVAGTLISSTFLFVIAIINISILVGLRALFRKLLQGGADGDFSLDELMSRMGVMNRLFRRLFLLVKDQRYLYPIGLLFGLGFDTASEVLILSISATLAGVFAHVPLYTLLIFPALFTLGMTLIDTTDGYMMNRAYRWAFSDPVKKIWYNMTMTVASIAFAVIAGTFELMSLLVEKFGMNGYPWSVFATVSNSYWAFFGILILSTFSGIWILSYFKYRKAVVNGITT